MTPTNLTHLFVNPLKTRITIPEYESYWIYFYDLQGLPVRLSHAKRIPENTLTERDLNFLARMESQNSKTPNRFLP